MGLVALGMGFAWAGAVKLHSPELMAGKFLELSGVTPSHAAVVLMIVRAIGGFEIVCAVLILAVRFVGRWRVLVGTSALAFALWDSWRLVQGDSPECGCFGTLFESREWWHVGVKQAVVALLVVSYILPRRSSISLATVECTSEAA
jgi:hypothetical protein